MKQPRGGLDLREGVQVGADLGKAVLDPRVNTELAAWYPGDALGLRRGCGFAVFVYPGDGFGREPLPEMNERHGPITRLEQAEQLFLSHTIHEDIVAPHQDR